MNVGRNGTAFMSNYEKLIAVLAKHGVRCYLQGPEQLVVSDQPGSPWPDGGNSFWVTRLRGVASFHVVAARILRAAVERRGRVVSGVHELRDERDVCGAV
jgi:hypothetical protein